MSAANAIHFEIVHQGEEEDRIADLSERLQATAWVTENERRAQWNQAQAGLRPRLKNQLQADITARSMFSSKVSRSNTLSSETSSSTTSPSNFSSSSALPSKTPASVLENSPPNATSPGALSNAPFPVALPTLNLQMVFGQTSAISPPNAELHSTNLFSNLKYSWRFGLKRKRLLYKKE